MASDYEITQAEFAGAMVAARRIENTIHRFGARMRRLRLIAGLTPAQLAERMKMPGVGAAQIAAAEGGEAVYGYAMARAAILAMPNAFALGRQHRTGQ